MPTILSSLGGGGGFSAWTAGSYARGSIVSRGGYLWAANTATSQDPCVVDGDVGSSTDWQFNLGAGAGLGQTAGAGVLLVNNVNATNSNCVSKTVRSGYFGSRLMTEVSLGGNASADGYYFGILNGTLPATTGGTLHVTAGFYGVFLDVFNNVIKLSVNGSIHATTVAYNKSAMCSAGAQYDRWWLDFIDAGATMSVLLRRQGLINSSGNVMATAPDEYNGIAGWTGIAKPAFATDYRFALGAFTGGFNMRVHVRTGGTCILPITSDWACLGPTPRFNS